MALRFRLANYQQSSTVNMYDGTLQLRDMSWATRAPGISNEFVNVPYGAQIQFVNYEPITETFGLIAEGTEATIIAAVRDFQAGLEGARLYHLDPYVWQSWWLEANTADESARRSLLYEGSLQVQSGVGYEPLLDCGAAMIQATLTRHPFWENTSQTTQDNSYIQLSCTGGMGALSDPTGDVPARIWRTSLSAGGVAYGGPVTRVWLGMREAYEGYANFESVWECEDGTNGTDAADAVDATASAGDKVTVTYVDTSLVKRWSMTVNEACTAGGHADHEHFYGSYLVLLRAKVSGGVSGVELRQSYDQATAEKSCEEIFISSTSWDLYELGEVHMPPMGRYAGGPNIYDIGYVELRIYAEQITAGNLDLDCIILIPSRHFFHTDGSYIVYSGGDERPLWVVCKENDEFASFALWGNYQRLSVSLTHRDYYMPACDGFFVIAGAQATTHDLGDDLDVDFQFFPRWMTYRETGGT